MDLGIRQADVAAAVGVTVATIQAWENGHTDPDLRRIPAIIRFLGRNPRPLPATLAGQIRHLRQARGLSTRDLARRLGTDPATVEQWERGECRPGPRLFGSLVQILDIPPPDGSATQEERLRFSRLALGLTQKAAGRLIGVGGDKVSAWERGELEPPAAYLAALRPRERA